MKQYRVLSVMSSRLSYLKLRHFQARPVLWEVSSGWDLPVFE